MRLVVMGVSGCGKTTIGQELASQFGVTFIDADDLHPTANKTKMSSGIPLTDDDRWPWLERVGDAIASHEAVVVACSALKKSYREKLLSAAPDTKFIYLRGSRELLLSRLERRSNHFMPSTLLDSQLATLEDLTQDEPGFVVSIDQSVAEIIDECTQKVGELFREF